MKFLIPPLSLHEIQPVDIHQSQSRLEIFSKIRMRGIDIGLEVVGAEALVQIRGHQEIYSEAPT